MSGFFKRKKSKTAEENQLEDDDPYLDLITKKVNDAHGAYFGEVVSADEDFIVIKHEGAFYRFPENSIQNRFGDLMVAQNVDLTDARNQGDTWKNMGKKVIGENKFYDFTEERRREREREAQILEEMEKVRELALQSQAIPEPPTEPVPKENNDGDEDDSGDVEPDEVSTPVVDDTDEPDSSCEDNEDDKEPDDDDLPMGEGADVADEDDDHEIPADDNSAP